MDNTIVFTQGDLAVLNLQATDGDGNPIDISGSTFTTQIKGPNGVIVSFPNSQHAIVDGPNGFFSLTLQPNDTSSCGLGTNKDILTQIVSGGSPIYFRGQGILTVNPPVPLQ